MKMKAALVIIDMQMLMQQRLDAGRDHVNADAPPISPLWLRRFARQDGE
jgi:hypothetical protein